MLRNYIITALRNLARNKFYSAISIFGLSIGICAALLAALVVRNQLTYDHFIPGYERTYVPISILSAPQMTAPNYNSGSHGALATVLKLRFPEVEAVTRLSGETVVLQHGQIAAKERISWADPNVFDLLPVPTLAGDLTTALRRADSIVLTRSMARKYFGRDNPIGETIQLTTRDQMKPGPGPDHRYVPDPGGTYPVMVTAIIEDLPNHGSSLESGIFASSLASFSRLRNDPFEHDSDRFGLSGPTYVRLKPGADISQLQEAMPALIASDFPRTPPGTHYAMEFVRMDRLNLHPGLNPGVANRLSIMSIIGALILFIACVNFVNLTTARSARRALEIGIRKSSGAGRGALILQYLGESIIYVLLATCIAIALAEWSLSYVNAFLDTTAIFDYWRNPAQLSWIGAGIIGLGILAGLYPAIVLSSFRPVGVLKGLVTRARNSGAARQLLVTSQFAILTGLIIAGAVVYQQRIYAGNDALRVNADQVLVMRLRSPDGDWLAECDGALKAGLQALAGVRDISCTSGALLDESFVGIKLKDGTPLVVDVADTEPNLFGILGLKPMAGTFSQRPVSDAPHYVINEAAVRGFRFTSAQAAIGQTLPTLPIGPGAGQAPGGGGGGGVSAEISGVVSDFSLWSVERKVMPTVYFIRSSRYNMIVLKLAGQSIPETLTAIDRLWIATGAKGPIDRFFLNDYIQNLYLSVLREAQAFGVFSLIAVLLACLGLLGLSASTAERRTKEIGIRKSMGASTGDILRLLSWEFAKPVLLANLIAWPVAWYAMNRWLAGFAYHIDLAPWMFVSAGAAALIIALATVSAQSYLVARAKPVEALRYE